MVIVLGYFLLMVTLALIAQDKIIGDIAGTYLAHLMLGLIIITLRLI